MENIVVNNKDIITDLTTFAAIDSLKKKELGDWRHKELLLQLIDYSIDPTRDIFCIYPTKNIGEGTFLPDTYLAFKDIGLVSSEKNVCGSDFPLKDEAYQNFFNTFILWCNSHKSYPTVIKNFHTNPIIKPGFDERVGIPERVTDFINDQVSNQSKELANSLNWNIEELTIVFSILCRGIEYARASGEVQKAYFTHPIRRISGAETLINDDKNISPSIILSPYILYSWEKNKSNFCELAEMVSNVKNEVKENEEFKSLWQGAYSNFREIENIENKILKKTINGSLSYKSKKFVNRTILASLGTILLGTKISGMDYNNLIYGTTTLTLLFYNWKMKDWIDLFLDKISIPKEISSLPIIRPMFDYPKCLDYNYIICPKCGTETGRNICPVCSFHINK